MCGQSERKIYRGCTSYAEGSKVLWAENLGVSEDGKLLKGDERALLIEVKNV